MQTRPRSTTWRARRIHRWLGLFIGVQFVLWTVGGLYFSWTRLEDVHGDHLMRPPGAVAASAAFAQPSAILARLREREPVDSIVAMELASVLGRPTWRIAYVTTAAGRPVRRRQLADAETGALREALTRDEAVAAARAAYTGSAPVIAVEHLAEVGRHHEYREMPLPAWAVRFGDEEGATAYVAAELGHVVRIRNDAWRAFDFLWMLHTMDYRGRDDFNNLLLRAFSVLGLVTVASGFVLFALTTRWGRERIAHARANRRATPTHAG